MLCLGSWIPNYGSLIEHRFVLKSQPAGWDLLRSHPVRLQTNSIIDSIAKSLFAAQVAFCCLHGNVPQQKLNLLKFTASLMA